VKSLVEQTVNTFGRLDAAFNNAGILSPAVETADVPSEVFDRVSAINLSGVWLCMKYELIQMRAQGSGAIVNNYCGNADGRRHAERRNGGYEGNDEGCPHWPALHGAGDR